MRDLLAGVGQIAEPVLVQALIAEAPVETLHVAILHRSPGLDRVPLETLLVGPLIDRAAHELGSVVAADLPRQSASLLQFFQYAHHAHSTQRGVDLDRQALPRVVIHDVQGTKPPPRAERIGHEVHRPHLVGCQGRRQRLAHCAALPATLAPQCQLFLYVQPVHALMVDLPSFALQQDL
jgi:hypothetical protein